MSYIYIASPYSDPDPKVRDRRYNQVAYYAASLLLQRRWAYSPVIHCHELAKNYRFPTSFAFWAEYNFTMLTAAGLLHVLQLEGWDRSVGVCAEVAWWKTHTDREQIQYVSYTK